MKEIKFKDITCYVCGEISQPATPIYQNLCSDCYGLMMAAASPKIYTLGHPANASYIHEENKSAIKIWEEHLKKHGFVKKWRRWRKKK